MDTSLLKTGDVLICRGNSSLSGLIKKATHSEWSHTAQIIILFGEVFIIDAQADGIGVQNFKFWMDTYNYDFEVYRDPSLVNREIWAKKALWYSRIKYDKKGLAVGLFKSLCIKWFPSKNMDDSYRNNGKFWCSEFTMKLVGVSNPEDFSPQGVLDYVRATNWDKINL